MHDREKVIERLTGLKELLKFQKDILGYGSFIEDINDALALIEEQEAEIDEISDEYLDIGKEMAKQPKIILCKDCKWRGHEYDSTKWIPCLVIRTGADWFCADGELTKRQF